jgi:transcriptional regulator with XRE-family HTH domain
MNQLRKYRKLANLTMMDIVNITRGEFSQSRLSSYETGARQLTVEAALVLAPILKVSAAQLLGISDKDKETQKLGDQQQELFNLLSDISLRGEKDVAQVAAMLRAYLQHQ